MEGKLVARDPVLSDILDIQQLIHVPCILVLVL